MVDHNLSPLKSWNSNENILSVHPREVVMAFGGWGEGGGVILSCVLLPPTVDCCACLDKSRADSR